MILKYDLGNHVKIHPIKVNNLDFPRGSCGSRGGRCILYEGSNILGRDRIQYQVNGPRTVGIIMADFPGSTLIREIIDNNCKIRNSLCK